MLMQYKIAICDDESLHIEKIRNALPDQESEIFTDSQALLNAVVGGKRYDVLFLDILMPKLDGISLARELRAWDTEMLIVFITSQVEYMQTGYEVRAFRYLLKDQIETGLPIIWKDIERELLERQDAYFTYAFERKTYRVPLRDILYLESELRRIVIHTTSSDTAFLYGKLDDLASAYPSFVRIHKSYLVNRRHIRTISVGMVVLTNGDLLPVSRKYAFELEKYK